ncbi:MAG: DUF1499 domain-containing protein [Thermoanaerobaculia bacterium]
MIHRLSDCPSTPNCVSSQARDPRHHVAPLRISGPAESVMTRVSQAVLSLPGARLELATDTYLRARVRTPLFRFVDDLELLLDSEAGLIHVRSASRAGTWDLGANRRRVEKLRRKLEGPAPPRS